MKNKHLISSRFELPDNPCLDMGISQSGPLSKVSFQPEGVEAKLYVKMEHLDEEMLAASILFRQFDMKSVREIGIPFTEAIKAGNPYVDALADSSEIQYQTEHTDIMTVIMGIKIEPDLYRTGIEYVALSKIIDAYDGYFVVIAHEKVMQPYRCLSFLSVDYPKPEYKLPNHVIMLYFGDENRYHYDIVKGRVTNLMNQNTYPGTLPYPPNQGAL